ncbi:hypothetical protein ARMGADRAFT_553988 [Armillaria gallica]|uniref:Uncharacterized protein n=1 Tax=Armillaria gallica TaxID=47427 RepID=A0A2H3CWA0_ARMGA|nr:hypothetical protein ARMGADRAFT_553988 [Armillaria gallica]
MRWIVGRERTGLDLPETNSIVIGVATRGGRMLTMVACRVVHEDNGQQRRILFKISCICDECKNCRVVVDRKSDSGSHVTLFHLPPPASPQILRAHRVTVTAYYFRITNPFISAKYSNRMLWLYHV